jgi:hypothetical protein
MIIDSDGLFNGQRLRRCSARARFLWPYLFLLSNRFGRIEFDFDAIAFKFASFGEAAPTSPEISDCFAEYERHHLILVFGTDGQRWGQWDTRRTRLSKFKTVSDRQSPTPPEPAYTDWLREQHRDDWPAYHCTEVISEDRKEPGRDPQLSQDLPNSLAKVTQKLLNSAPILSQDFGLGVGVGVGEGNGGGDGGGRGSGGGGRSSPRHEAADIERTPDDLPPVSLAAHLIEILGVPTNQSLLMAVAQSIATKARVERLSPAAAHDFILLKATLAQKQGQSKPWRFYFQDADYDKKTKQEASHEWLSRHAEDTP